ncbi:MAG: glycosyltransferase [Flavobacteriaceae bacterium]|nr:glycosyltransferase [Flavobacteriaceae bacterium]
MIYIVGSIIVLYILSMIWIAIGIQKLPFFTAEIELPRTEFSVLIPFRNEEKNLSTLLKSLHDLNYPKNLYEVILINDGSTDDWENVIQAFENNTRENPLNLRIVNNQIESGSPKKDAITLGNKLANNDWIVTTDADCQLPLNWLNRIDQGVRKKQPKMIFGPILYSEKGSFEHYYQFLDGLSLQAASMAGFGWKRPFLCNAANMAYRKEVFQEVKGYEGNNHVSSGDDIFLMEKVSAKYPKRLFYLKSAEATVITTGEDTLKEIVSQRIRWASKTSKQPNALAKLLGWIVFLANLCFILAFLMIRTYGEYQWWLLSMVITKIVMDFVVLRIMASTLRKNISVGKFLLSALAYPLVSVWVVFGSLFGKYSWKGRAFRK